MRIVDFARSLLIEQKKYLQILGSQLQCLNIESTKVNVALRFEEALKDLWQKNGDSCSVVYAGTGAIEGKSKVLLYICNSFLSCVACNRSFFLFFLSNKQQEYATFPSHCAGTPFLHSFVALIMVQV